MEFTVVFGLLAASLLHASWHALVKSTSDRIIALAGMNAVSATLALLLLPLTETLPDSAIWIVAGSVALHFLYKVSLARLYRVTDLSQAYPLARGLTPLVATSLAFFTIGETPRPIAALGIALVSAGLVLLPFDGKIYRISAPTIVAGLVASVAVACYSVLDAYGVRLTGDLFSFTVWLMLIDGGIFVAYVAFTRRKRMLDDWMADWDRVLISGLFGVVSFAIFMWALSRAPIGAVSALRETSVLFATIIGGVVLKERLTWVRYAAAMVVTLGVGIIALSR